MNLPHKSSSTRELLIVSPHFPPSNGADMHRVRAVLPYLSDFGWHPTVLAVAPDSVHVPQDPWLECAIPSNVTVHRVQGLGLGWSRIPGLGTIDFRAMRSMRRTGLSLLREQHFDLVYFSTTAFGLHVLGPYWKRRTSVPFVMDYQDPWVSDYYRQHPEIRPPGGRLKYSVIDRVHRFMEPRVLRQCSGITSVSAAYPRQLLQRYPWLKHMPATVLPFPGVGRDFERIGEDSAKQELFSPNDGKRHWVYVGRGGGDMATALSGFFDALRRWRTDEPDEFARTRLHFIGTSYAPSGQGTKTILPIAEQYQLGEVVSELTDRISYSTMLRCLLDADALIMPGSNDPAYTASKLYPYLLARKPLLAIFHRASSVVDVMRSVGGGQLSVFDESTSTDDLSNEITQTWFQLKGYDRLTPLDEVKFEPLTDRGSARQLCAFFDGVLSNNNALQCS